MAASISFVEKRDTVFNLELKKDVLETWTKELSFKRGEAGKHFAKHKNDGPLRDIITNVDSYVNAAQANIIDTIFKKGFVLRTGRDDRIAFFSTSSDSDFPDKMTVVAFCAGGLGARILTFFSTNGKTPALTVKSFQSAPPPADAPKDLYTPYVAFFEGGKSSGWRLFTDWRTKTKEIVTPDLDLHSSIKFF